MAKPVVKSLRSDRQFISLLHRDYPEFKFQPGDEDHWSAKSGTITYNPRRPLFQRRYSLLHELAHAVLGHISYTSDFELLKLEAEAWQLAAKIGHKYQIEIEDAHIQNCLDTYRDWLYRRSTCPRCGTHVLQKDSASYHCYNCQTDWQVSSGRFVRPYRRRAST